jgi:HlyD family secretion protein
MDEPNDEKTKRWLIRGGVAALLAAVALGGWLLLRPKGLGPGIVAGNGRVEATEIDISAKTPGRIADILVDEGDFVKQGQVVAHVDTQVLEAQRSEAEAQLAQAQNAIQTALSQVSQQESNRAAARAVVEQRQAELNAAGKRLARSTALAREGATPQQEQDDRCRQRRKRPRRDRGLTRAGRRERRRDRDRA